MLRARGFCRPRRPFYTPRFGPDAVSMSFQEFINRLLAYWADQGCVILQP